MLSYMSHPYNGSHLNLDPNLCLNILQATSSTQMWITYVIKTYYTLTAGCLLLAVTGYMYKLTAVFY
jgi:hypothetical protein